MNPLQPAPASAFHLHQPYEVQVGHARVQVTAHSILDAIRQARVHLCQEMPWLWDMIHGLEDHRFFVRSK